MYKESSKPLNLYSERHLRRQAMQLSMKEGCFAIVMVALVEAFYIPYLNAMGASPLQIGLGASLPALASAFIQLYIPMALYKSGSRKRLVVTTALVQALCFVPFGLMCQINRNWAVWPAIAAFTVSAVSGSLGGTSWADWMADIVPARRRGKYFAYRNRILGVIQLAVAVTAGYLLDHLAGKVLLTFTIIWFVCFAAKTCSGIMHKFMYEPPRMANQNQPEGSFLAFLRQLPSTKFGRFTLATSLLGLGVSFAGPFFAVHMLNNLKFSYSEYTVVNVTATAAVIAFLGLWGGIIDRVGAILPLRLCAIIITLIPLPWVIFENYWLLLCAQILSGFAWAGFSLAVFVYYLGSVAPQTRISGMSYFNALGLFCASAGSTLGGWLGPYLPVLTNYYLQTVFLISFALRLGPALMFYRIKEEKLPAGKLTLVEKLFFEPTLILRPSIARSMLRLPKRSA